MSDGQLWLATLVQIAVVGSAASGESLHRTLGKRADSWYQRLLKLQEADRTAEIHRQLRQAGVRYVTSSPSTCRKTAAAAENFRVLDAYGGPLAFFRELAQVPVERWRLAIVRDSLSYIKLKGARDLLITLGLLDSAVALDSRVQGVLRRLGVPVPNGVATNVRTYSALESELLEKVCIPCNITGGHLDRILFRHYREVA